MMMLMNIDYDYRIINFQTRASTSFEFKSKVMGISLIAIH